MASTICSLSRLHTVLQLRLGCCGERHTSQAHHPSHQGIGHPVTHKSICHTTPADPPNLPWSFLGHCVENSVVQFTQWCALAVLTENPPTLADARLVHEIGGIQFLGCGRPCLRAWRSPRLKVVFRANVGIIERAEMKLYDIDVQGPELCSQCRKEPFKRGHDRGLDAVKRRPQ